MNFCQLIDPNYKTAWFHEVIGDILQDVVIDVRAKKKRRIIITLPPRTGKTQLTSIYFPAWALGNHPDLRFILSTYGAELSEKVGMKTRDVVQSKPYNLIFPDTKLRQDTKSKTFWMTDKGGHYYAVGVGGAVTGTGADCLTGDAEIITEDGKYTIENLYRLQQDVKVLSYNHDNNKFEFKKVVAKRKIKKTTKQVFRVTTHEGAEITCTADHRFFDGTRYKEIRLFKPGETIWNTELQGDTNSGNQNNMLSMWKEKMETVGRICEGYTKRIQGFILQRGMFIEASRSKKQKEMQNMRKAMRKENNGILQQRMQAVNVKTTENKMSVLSNGVSTNNEIYTTLFKKMRGLFTFSKDERTKPKLEAWYVDGSVSKRVPSNKNINIKPRREYVRRLFEYIKTACASYRQQSEKQQSQKSGDSLCNVSHKTPLIKKDTISMVEEVYGEHTVYDIQVEDNHNFFANGILVHNCIIVDDLLKNREDAESKNMQEKAWEYYRSTLYSRLEGAGAVIVIMQRWNNYDLVGRLVEEQERLKKEGEEPENWEIVNFPAIAEEEEFYKGKLVRKPGEALWEEKFPLSVLDNIKQVQGSYNWFSQYMQNPIHAENQEFRSEMFRKYDESEVNGKYLRYYTVIDPAISQKDNADNSVVLTVAKEIDGPNIYRIKEDAGHYTPKQLIDLIFKHQKEYNSSVWLETVAFQKALKYALEEDQKIKGQYFKVNELKANNKEMRIRGLLPMYERGVIFHRPYGDVDYESELLQFPRGKHDDRIDAMSYAIAALDEAPSQKKVKQFYPHLHAKKRLH